MDFSNQDENMDIQIFSPSELISKKDADFKNRNREPNSSAYRNAEFPIL